MRFASPSGSSNCRVRIAQTKAASPTPPKSSETGIRIVRISTARPPYFSRSALSDTVIEDVDIAAAAARGVAIPTSASGTATTL